jgi:hypothetical protein
MHEIFEGQCDVAESCGGPCRRLGLEAAIGQINSCPLAVKLFPCIQRVSDGTFSIGVLRAGPISKARDGPS